MSQAILLAQPELGKKMVVITGKDFASECLYTAKYFTMPVKTEKSDFIHLFLDFSKPHLSPDRLSPSEISDVEESWREIEQGNSRRCSNIDEFLAELKR